MAGASIKHELIVSNLNYELRSKLRGRGCSILLSNTRVKVPIYSPYRYPDLSAPAWNQLKSFGSMGSAQNAKFAAVEQIAFGNYQPTESELDSIF